MVQHQTRRGALEIMEPNLRKTCPPDQPLEVLNQIAVIHRSPMIYCNIKS